MCSHSDFSSYKNLPQSDCRDSELLQQEATAAAEEEETLTQTTEHRADRSLSKHAILININYIILVININYIDNQHLKMLNFEKMKYAQHMRSFSHVKPNNIQNFQKCTYSLSC